MKVPQQAIIVREKTRKEKRKDEVTASLIIGVLSCVTGALFLSVMLIKLFTR